MSNPQIHDQKDQEPLKKYQAIHPNSVCIRIFARHIGSAIFIYLFIFNSDS